MMRFVKKKQRKTGLTTNRKKSSNSKQKAGNPHKQWTFRLLMRGVIPF